MQPMANLALKAARLAGQHIIRAFDRPDLIKVTQKGPNDYVTNIDMDAQRIIIDSLRTPYPEHSFLGEEKIAVDTLLNEPTSNDNPAENNPAKDYQWVIDPIDGTANFMRNIPHFCVSIACLYKGKVEHGVILDPVRQEEFVASRGQGCQLNGRRVRVRPLKGLSGAMISTDGRGIAEVAEQQMAIYKKILNQGALTRQAGSAALDLAYIAAGRLDAMWMRRLKLWDVAAGALMVTEAGGLLGDHNGGAGHLKTGNIIAASPHVFKLLTPIVKKHLGKISNNQ
ncbi:MAG: inositol monophosphatase [Pseudomonadales bacterium]|nr:inositol monophosphatase [Pseudomonadales bacterium]